MPENEQRYSLVKTRHLSKEATYCIILIDCVITSELGEQGIESEMAIVELLGKSFCYYYDCSGLKYLELK